MGGIDDESGCEDLRSKDIQEAEESIKFLEFSEKTSVVSLDILPTYRGRPKLSCGECLQRLCVRRIDPPVAPELKSDVERHVLGSLIGGVGYGRRAYSTLWK